MPKTDQPASAGSCVSRRLSISYQLALAGAALVMLLLPAVYLLLIAGILWLLYWYAIIGGRLLEHPNMMTVLLYLGPLVAGVIVILFMIKPLFARPKKGAEPLIIALDQHPKLQSLIAQICREVGTPVPSRVLIDNQLNASASFRRGWWGLFSRDLELTLGLPLVAGLNASQFAAVVAHEFGHFSQAGGMTASFIIRMVNGWFYRVVFQRDQMDEWLVENARNADARIMLILKATQGAVWLSRRVLHGLMYVGQAVCCYLLRQMEYDADACAVLVLGSEANLGVQRELDLLGVATNQAFAGLGVMWREQRLVDDFSTLVVSLRKALAGEVLEKVSAAMDSEKPHWNDTHPTRRQREERIKALNDHGVLQLEGSAIDLFEDFQALSREVTLHYYRAEAGLTVEADQLMPAEALLRLKVREQEEDLAASRLAPHGFDARHPCVLPDLEASAAGSLADLLAELKRQRAILVEGREAFSKAQEDFNERVAKLGNFQGARSFLESGIKVDAESFGLISSSLPEASSMCGTYEQRVAEAAEQLKPADAALGCWLAAAETLARLTESQSEPPAGPARELLALSHLFRALAPLWSKLPMLSEKHSLMLLFLRNANPQGNSPGFMNTLGKLREEIEGLLDAGLAQAAEEPYPFSVLGEGTRVGAYFAQTRSGQDRYAAAHAGANAAYDLYHRLMRRMVWCGEQLEKSPAYGPAGDVTP